MLLHNKINPVSLSLSLSSASTPLELDELLRSREKRSERARAEQGLRQVLIQVEYPNPCMASDIYAVWPASS